LIFELKHINKRYYL